MLTSLDNPFQINENSMFHPNNMQKQVEFDTSMPYQGFMANDAGGMQEQRPQHGSFGGGMFGN